MAGIYIHIPFCKQKCTYCDFHFSTTFQAYRDQMITALAEEIVRRKTYLEDQPIETIYFGGGTPSLLTAIELKFLLETINQHFVVTTPEITLEANPDDCTDDQLRTWKNVGINRLSIGLQSFKEADLKWMNRAHNAEESKASVQRALEHGFENITVDLMYGLPNLSSEEWRAHIQTVIDWGVPHISSYCLTVEEKTALHHLVKTAKIHVPDEDLQSEQFEILVQMLEANGWRQYEISNFSKIGSESKHNSNYWKGAWYLGIGPSAHSFNGVSRSWNVANNKAYLQKIASNEKTFEEEILSPKDQFNERILTGLRTIYGVSISALKSIHLIPNDFFTKVDTFKSANWLLEDDGILTLTREGRLRADYIASELFL